ncbi:SH3 domain-containing protein [Rugamonas aquatica]|uniref:SH3 domain-containing protein n=1 Tax=Rugamonas aquatica TaxID=2743357 RepID=A0A6A7N5E3_9BURK|nr:SH3 domain-containing protein [Rugamonas aquatica]MQA40335.1 SH3 domain-containing protein [Rugamonas aquatica]
METAKLYAAGAFAAGLVITLFLAAYLTPRQWWRRPNARALFISLAGAWGFGSLILYAAHARQNDRDDAPAVAATSTAAQAAPDRRAEARAITAAVAARDAASASAPASLIAGHPFAVHRDLNLRTAAGVHAARLITVPAGAIVTPTGLRSGDWWQIKASVAGHENTGWVNSLWLRRSGE